MPSDAHQITAQIMNLPYKELNELSSQKPEGLTDSTYKMFKTIGSACNTCICKVCEYLKGQTMPTSAIRCDCKPCNCTACTGSGNNLKTTNIELRLRYKNKFRNELDYVKSKGMPNDRHTIDSRQDRTSQRQQEECKQKAFGRSTVTVAPVEESGPPENCRCVPCSCNHNTQRGLNIPCIQTHEMSTGINRRENCQCENCLDNSCQPNNTDACKCSERRGVFRKPTEKYVQDYDIHSATVESQPVIIKGKRPASFYDTFPCISGTYQCRNKNAGTSRMETYNFSKLQKSKSIDPESCKCTQCVCLACSFPKQTLYTDSLESLRTCVMCNHSENRWKGRSKFDDRGHKVQYSKKGCIRVVDDPCNTIINSAERKPRKKINHGCNNRTGQGTPVRPCQCTKNDNCMHKPYFKEILDNVYSDLNIDDHEKSSSKLNLIPSGQQIRNNYAVCTLVNSETNTENHIANKCIETDSYPSVKKKFTDSKVKNYEYTLRIEIQTPNLNETKEATKEKIKKDSKKGVTEQTKKVVRELFSDISKNSLFSENLPENSKTDADEQKPKNMDSSEHNKVRSILKQYCTPSKTTEPPSLAIQTNSTTELPSSTKSKNTTLEDCFFVRCLPQLQDAISQMTEKNEWKQIFPVATEVAVVTPANSMENLNSATNTENTETIDARDLEELRVLDPCVRRVSDHTVSLKWKLPKAIEDVTGYEILIDGKSIETILNPTRCLAVVSCLPPVSRILITIRTITKTPGLLPGLIPCTTIGYRPRANKTICI